jgi:DNA invertase Pin-like site-specific DNA recombinase
MKQQVAIYLRLSLEDVDKRTNKIKDDSNSITAQRLLIHRHLDQDPVLCDLPRMEFCDDGFTGTSFDRPGFTRMIEQAKKGEISCIVVKDLSRFGRDYLEVGDYLEHIFPFLGIRFKAINDHYDSGGHQGKTIGMDVAFKNLIYDHYSKDLSQKVKSAMNIKQKECRYVNTPPYGYTTSPADKHQLVIDHEVAPVVRRIFMDVIAGKSCTQIARELNIEGVPTPSQHKGSRYLNSGRPPRKPQWTRAAIHTILGNIKYTGVMVNHTRESRFIRDKSQRRVPKEDWYLKENAHAAIVTQDEYDRAQNAIQRRQRTTRVSHDRSDRVYYCAHCGSKLEKANGTVFACPSRRYQDESPCENVRCRKEALEGVLLAALKNQICITKAQAVRARAESKRVSEELGQRAVLLKAQMESCDREKFIRYENYRECRISQEAYLQARDALDQEKAALEAQLKECEARLEAQRNAQENATAQASAVSGLEDLPNGQLKEHLYDAIERVLVYDAEDIEIRWKFDEVKTGNNIDAGVSS